MRPWILLHALLLVSLAGCAASGYEKSYQAYADPAELKDARALEPGGTPRVVVSEDLDRDMKLMRSRGYVAVGQSAFNGAMASSDDLTEQARRVGAVLVLVRSDHTTTQTTTIPLTVPNKGTGTGSGPAATADAASGAPSPSGSMRTSTLPVVTQQERFDQFVVYYVESTRRPRCGLFLGNPGRELAALTRRGGALITNIAEGTPAFDSDILPGDLLLEVNGTPVRDASHALELLRASEATETRLLLKTFRRGSERLIHLTVPGVVPENH